MNGISSATDGTGVYGHATAGTVAKGVHGECAPANGWAGYFDGDVFVSGDLDMTTAAVAVDHPDDPGGQWYRRALVGAFEEVTVISGNARTGAGGRVAVRVSDLFARMHKDFRYQLTPLGETSKLFVSRQLTGGRFTIQADRAGLDVSWQITGVRNDPAAKRFAVTSRKTGGQRGRYVAPELYGQPPSRSLSGPRARSDRATSTSDRGQAGAIGRLRRAGDVARRPPRGCR